jgi:GT2 family glycosyltransferase
LNIDLLVLGYGQFETTTKKCLESILPQVDQSFAKVYVLDNGSPDDSAEKQKIFCKNYIWVESFYSETNLGYAGGMNYLAEKSVGDWLMLIGSDTIFYPNALGCMFQALSTVPESVGLVGPVTNSAGTAQCLQALGDDVSSAFSKAKDIFDLPSGIILPLYRADFFCVAIRRSIWNQLNGLDEIYGLGYYEDFDFSMRAKSLGFACVMVEDALVFHQGSASFKNSTKQSELLKKNKMIFLLRFPKAELRHIREDLYLSILSLLNIDFSSSSTNQLAFDSTVNHLKLRIESLELNKPKGLVKRLIWKKKVRVLNHQFQEWQKSLSKE